MIQVSKFLTLITGQSTLPPSAVGDLISHLRGGAALGGELLHDVLRKRDTALATARSERPLRPAANSYNGY